MGYDINQDGQVVGTAQDDNWHYLPFSYSQSGELRALQFPANVHDGKSAITYSAAEGEWYASTLNDNGLIGGHFTITAEDKAFPYYWSTQSAAPIAIPLPAGFHYGEVYGVNAAGVIVGTMWDNGDDERAFVFAVNQDTVARDLNAVTLLGAGTTLRFAVDINSDGLIVGYGSFGGKERGFVLTGYAPDIAIYPSPDAIFGTREVGSRTTQTLTVSNDGNAPLVLGNLLRTGGQPASGNPFQTSADFCSGATLQPTQDCTLDLDFTPTAQGDFSASFALASNDPDENPKLIAVSGTGSITPVADIDLSLNGTLQSGTELSYSFGRVKTNSSVSATIRNSGSGPLVISSILLATSGGPVSLTSDSCTGATLAAGQKCSFQVNFSSQEAGDFSNTLTITSNDPDEGTLHLNLTGQWLAADVNASPTAAIPIYPAHGQREVERTPTFKFRPSTDPEGDQVSYSFYLSTTPDFSGTAPLAMSGTTIFLAGLGFAAALLLIPGLPGRQNRRRKLLLAAALILLTAATLLISACGGGGGGGGGDGAAATGGGTPAALEPHLRFTYPTPLSANTTYYWKVVSNDGQGGSAETETRSFTTGP